MPKYKVTFKEAYLPHEVERTCDVPSRKDVIDIYGLEEKDIEWYKIEEIWKFSSLFLRALSTSVRPGERRRKNILIK